MTDKVQWVCPKCGFSVRIRRFPVYCKCGYVTDKPPIRKTQREEAESENTQDEVERREAVCEKCRHFTGIKCDLICKNCSGARKWQQAVRYGNCPEGKWRPDGWGHKLPKPGLAE